MVMKKIISTLLAVLMLAGSFSIVVGAQETEVTFEPERNTNSYLPTSDYLNSVSDFFDSSSEIIDTQEEKLDNMDLRLEKDGYRLYVDAYSGEVAVECISSGEVLFTNPYDLNKNKADWKTKVELLSQLVVNFKDITTGQTQSYYSGSYSVAKAYSDKGIALPEAEIQQSQILVRNIKNGLRVEYTIGREQSKMLVPRVIAKDAYETKVLEPLLVALDQYKQELYDQYISEGMDEKRAADWAEAEYKIQYGKFKFYKLYDPEMLSEKEFKNIQTKVGFAATEACYILDPNLKSVERARIEQRIKNFIPTYTYEEMDSDHLTMGYVDQEKNPHLFHMALEYTLDDQGLSVRLPANGISFNESLYELISIEILPYMGAGYNANSGYTFFPDGSGTLFDFEEIAATGTDMSVAGTIYGQDYAYHSVSGAHKEVIRYPVFGIIEEQTINKITKNRGFVAIVEEGDAMMELLASHETMKSGYNTVKMRVYPRPQDTYNVADAISVGSNDTWTVVSSRKYTGNYKIRYIMLTPEETAPTNIKTFDTSYVGMAMAYRDYLENKGILTQLTAEDVNVNSIPLFIETFGSMQTTERFLSIPVDVMTPLTTFEDIKLMYGDLAAAGVGNINFILTGFASGGMSTPTVPYNLSWESVLEKSAQTNKEDGYDSRENMTFSELLKYSQDAEHTFGLFPDFDFAFVKNDVWFDGLSLDQHAVKTIDNRYTSKREYSATKQTYISYFELALSPAYFNHFYEKLTQNFKNYLGYDDGEKAPGISVSTLGSYLNSDFDEEEPYNRADAKAFTIQAFEYFANNYEKVMTSGGNAFTWKYVDYITDIALDSSRYSDSAASIPFLGMVLHGYVEFAGDPINMEGNLDYAILKTIESGAGLQFILSYRNIENLKEDEILSQYYSINYKIWKDDVISIYTEVNEILKDLQNSIIVEHKFIEGMRIPDSDELHADAEAAVAALIAAQEENRIQAEKKPMYDVMRARKLLLGELKNIREVVEASYEEVIKNDWAVAKSAYKEAENLGASLAVARYDLEVAARAALDLLYGYLNEYDFAMEHYESVMAVYGFEEAKFEQVLTDCGEKVADGQTTYSQNLKDMVTEIRDFMNEVMGEGFVYDNTVASTNKNDNQSSYSKYETADNKIVYEEYFDGTTSTAFILNFNDYAVVVTNPKTGIAYSIEAYGYVKLKYSQNS